MRVVTAGIGSRAQGVLSVLKVEMPEMHIVGYYDPQPTVWDLIDADTPRFATVEAMLSDTKPDLFCVFSPNCFHLDQIRLGLEAGVRVFTEKPVVISIEETFALAELLAKYGSHRLMVGLVLRYSQHMVDLRSAMAAGALGAITSIEANEHIAPYHGAFFMRDWRRRTDLTGGFMLEKCCHDLDIYNMVTASRPLKVASFGGRKSYLPEHAPSRNSENDIFHVKKSIWGNVDDAFRSDGDIIDFQTAILSYESGAALAFHTNLNAPDEHRRFCIMGTHGMAEGDFVRGYLRVTSRDGSRFADNDYTVGDKVLLGAHYGADQMMAADIAAYLREGIAALPVSVIDALEAGVAALALDEARVTGQMVDLGPTWARFDSYGLQK